MTARRFMVVLLCLAAVVGAFFYFHYLHRGPNARGGSPIPALVDLAPPNSDLLLYVDFIALRASPFLKELTAVAPPVTIDRDYAAFVRATGFDYTRDLDRVLLAIGPGTPGSRVVVAEGRFDAAKIRAYALRLGKLEQGNRAEVYVVPGDTFGGAVSMVFLAPDRIALAENADVTRVFAPKATLAGSDADMRARIARVAGAPVFGIGKVGVVPENFSVGGLRSEQLANLVRSVRWVTVAARPDGNRLRLLADGECGTAENAEQLAGTLDGLRLLGEASLADPKTRQRMQPQAAQALDALLRSAQISREGRRVRLLFELTLEMLRAATAQENLLRP